jgi:hypothetical protein
MANTYSRIYIQTVFAVGARLSMIRPEFKEELYKYITGIVTNQGQKLIAVNGMSEKDEYLAWLKKFEMPFEDNYVFTFIE